MALSLRGLLKNNFKFITSNILKPVTNNATRHIYTPAALGIDAYIDVRKHITNQFQAVSQTFRAKMTEFTADDNKSLIFTEDLKAMLHIVENNPTDVDLVVKMIKKFHAQNTELRFGNYIFGPVVMRTLYFLDLPDLAYEMFKNPEFVGLFEQLTSYQILLTLLYNHGRFAQMREVYEIIKSKYTGGILHPHNSIVLVLASCCRENTPESFEYALNLWKDMNKTGFVPSRRTICLLSYLALKQGKPEFALELITSCQQFRHIEVRCIKIEAFVALNRLDDVLSFLKKIIHSEKFVGGVERKVSFFQDTIINIEEAVNADGPEKHEELLRILQEIRNQNLVQITTVESSLLRQIDRSMRRDKPGESVTPNRQQYTRNFQQSRITMKY